MEGNNNYVKRTFVLDLINEVNSSGGFKSYSDYSTMFDLVDDMPAADVQPVKHGKWSECYTDSHHYSGICSVCGRASIKSLTESLYEYCPRCGARMIKGGEIDE